MNLKVFLKLPAHEVADLVRSTGPRVVVCPVNGTRRWFALEGARSDEASFLSMALARYQALFALFFSHGISTLLTPILGPDIVNRGEDYLRMVLQALNEITSSVEFEEFYNRWDIRVRFYGDYSGYFEEKAPQILSAVEKVGTATRDHVQHRLFWGMFAQDPVEQIAREVIAFQAENGRAPLRGDIVTRYYGESLPPADMFIGMQPPVTFDFPLLDIGQTALYFTCTPTPYLDEIALRRILHDYMFLRPGPDSYDNVTLLEWDELRADYRANRADIVGLGRRTKGGHFWLPAGRNEDTGEL